MIEIRELKTREDFDLYKDAQDDVLHIIKMSASWCGPCRALTNIIKNLDSEKIGSTTFAEVDVDSDAMESVVTEYDVMALPAMFFFKNGEKVRKMAGLQSPESIYNTINELQ